MNPLEHVGNLYIENQRLLAEYRKLLVLIQQIKDGTTKPESVTVDIEKMTWALTLDASELNK